MIVNVHGNPVFVHTGGKPFNPALPCLVMLHGAQQDHSVWALQSRYLAHHGYTVLAPDLPGHGYSPGAPLCEISRLADWLWAMLDALGIKVASLIGHSMGSLIALEATSRAPHRVRRLALLGTAFPMKVSDTLLATAQQNEMQVIDMVTPLLQYGIAPKPAFPGPGFYLPALQRRLSQRIAKRHPQQVYFHDFSACNSYENGLQAAAKVPCPTLFICGENDQMTPAKAAQGLLAAIPGATMLKLPNCGHAMMAEQPDAVLLALRDWVGV